MPHITADSQITKLSTEKVIDLVRETRNSMIRHFLDDQAILSFFQSNFGINQVSAVKKEFLKRDLQELFKAPVDLVHYAAVIKDIKESHNISVPEVHLSAFNKELELIFKKYIF